MQMFWNEMLGISKQEADARQTISGKKKYVMIHTRLESREKHKNAETQWSLFSLF